MSLLPEFNQHFIDLWHIEVGRELARGKEPNAMQIPRDLLNPDLNPLTFDEVKAWFDWKAKAWECMYHGICPDDSHRYEIFLANHYFIHQDGYARQRLAENRIPFSNLLNELSDNPLYTFCQMKGYVNI